MHNLEQREDGTYSYVGAREDAWHRLGVTYRDVDGITVAQALTDLDVGTIEKLPVQGVWLGETGVTVVDDPRNVMTARVRKSGVSPLGITGPEYRIIDEREGYSFLEKLVDSGEALVSAAGLLDGGRKSFCCMRIPQDILIGGVDALSLYLLAVLDHTGSQSFLGLATPVRAVCQNTVDMALAGANRVWKLRHTRKAELKVDEARRSLALTFAYAGAIQAEAEKLIETQCTTKQFWAIVDGLYAPQGETSKRGKTMWETKREELGKLWTADTQDGITGTAWGAYNTLVEWLDWMRPVRGADDQVAAKFERALLGTNDAAKLKAQALVAVRAL